jgi:hypothetical protein
VAAYRRFVGCEHELLDVFERPPSTAQSMNKEIP